VIENSAHWTFDHKTGKQLLLERKSNFDEIKRRMSGAIVQNASLNFHHNFFVQHRITSFFLKFVFLSSLSLQPDTMLTSCLQVAQRFINVNFVLLSSSLHPL